MQSVLLVDDNPVNLKWLELLVQRLEQAQCASFTDPLAALEYARTHHVDLVVLDYLMPEMNGLQFIAAFSAFEGAQSVPLLMITAHDEKDVRYRALEAGAYDFLPKPVDAAEFLARARNLLRLREASLRLADHAAWLTREVELATREIRERERETVMALVKAAGYRDHETGAHISRVGHYAHLIAQGLHLSAQDQALMLDAAAMHDIGKVGIPDHILLKPAGFTPDEWAVMQTHTTMGAKILGSSKSPYLQMGAEIALDHHERWDGGGYPNGKRGEAISMAARIMNICDIYDALRSKRPYKPAFDHQTAVNIITIGDGRTQPEHFDPKVLAAFKQYHASFETTFDTFAQ